MIPADTKVSQITAPLTITLLLDNVVVAEVENAALWEQVLGVIILHEPRRAQ
ncbi:hypothetical protein [Hyphomicrobium sp.]|uniref:hypothetical protein n=1 Tax=Hyphomicrobium sp. TaxID=82 RepID=UPI0025BEE84E|nr:hypothetical protein [Hyphomicrobium sp.]MCC7252370.1 hypothetical protein [Hyphomicrobium sp.]